jgi:hypothetical protein
MVLFLDLPDTRSFLNPQRVLCGSSGTPASKASYDYRTKTKLCPERRMREEHHSAITRLKLHLEDCDRNQGRNALTHGPLVADVGRSKTYAHIVLIPAEKTESEHPA